MYYKRFIYGFANIAKPLTKLTEQNRISVVEAAFQTFKGALCAGPILA
jgi:hypothetical protein